MVGEWNGEGVGGVVLLTNTLATMATTAGGPVTAYFNSTNYVYFRKGDTIEVLSERVDQVGTGTLYITSIVQEKF